MKCITEKQIEEAIAYYHRAKNMLKRTMNGRKHNELSDVEYARANYWQGKIDGLEDVFDILGVPYRNERRINDSKNET